MVPYDKLRGSAARSDVFDAATGGHDLSALPSDTEISPTLHL